MSRLIALGCSYTYGEGLPDCLNLEENNYRAIFPSQFAWPSLLGKKLNKEVINLSIPGCSNRYIANEILNTDIQKDDLVIVLWTHYDRSIIFSKKEKCYIIHPTNSDKLNNAYFKHVYDPYNCFLESQHSIHYTNLYLSSKGVTIYNFQAEHRFPKFPLPSYATPSWNTVNIINQNLYYADFADDGCHPGIISQRMITRDMYLSISKKRIKLAH